MTQNATKPDDAESLYRAGIEGFRTGKPQEALENMRRAATLQPESARYCNALGQAFYITGNLQEGKAYLLKATKLDSNFALAWRNLGVLYTDTDDPQRACEALARSITANPSDTAAIQLFFETFSIVRFKVFNEWIKNVLILCLKNEEVEHRPIGRAWAWFFEIDPSFEKLRALKDEKTASIPDNLRDPFLTLGLQRLFICSMEFEAVMTKLRRMFLEEKNIAGHESFLCSLAMQCWLNEYVYFTSSDEKKKVQALKEELEKKIEDTPEYITKLCIYGSYESLLNLKNAGEISESLKNSSNAVFKNLLKFHIDEPVEESEIRRSLKTGAKIKNTMSKEVRAQYEENPYPRWKRVYMHKNPRAEALDILIAGCGTGNQSAIAAVQYPNAKIHNVDLSLSSLSYAIRQTQALGFKNLTFVQADILEMDFGGKQFDIIECTGVLHHMQNPEDGLKALRKLLKKDGTIALALYSEQARRSIAAAREFIAREKFGTTPDEIRRVRQAIVKHPDKLVQKCAERFDFYSLSACRDLILHVQEHRYMIPQIAKLLKENDLVFQEFVFPFKQSLPIFKNRFPEPEALIDLKKWEIFENENPDFFGSMYSFLAVPAR